MRYFKITLNTDLSQTSYRASVSTETHEYIEYNDGYIDPTWEELTEKQLVEEFGQNPFEEKPESQPYQPSNAEVAQMISDLQADLIIAGVI